MSEPKQRACHVADGVRAACGRGGALAVRRPDVAAWQRCQARALSAPSAAATNHPMLAGALIVVLGLGSSSAPPATAPASALAHPSASSSSGASASASASALASEACSGAACWAGAFFVAPVSAEHAAEMRGSVWRPGCPVAIDALREVHVAYRTPAGDVDTGFLVVHERVAADVVDAFRELLDAGFVVARVAPATVAGGDDARLMEANVTSAFNCRAITGGSSFSPHSWGIAIDINPLWNPYVRGDRVLPPSGRAWLVGRERGGPGLLVDGSAAVRAFERRGFTWGGRWRRPIDWQHFEKRAPRTGPATPSLSPSSPPRAP